MNKDIPNSESAKWNKVYQANPEKLPWFGLDFPKEVEEYLSALDHDDFMLVTGCGMGDVANALKEKGFTQVLGTDISRTAIEKAKIRFKNIAFETIATQEISLHEKFRNVNVFDWLNLHQVAEIEEYIKALGEVSKNICIVWINESDKEKTKKSYVHEGSIYYHDGLEVKKLLEEKGLSLKKHFDSSFTTNPQAGPVHEHKAIGQIYAKQ